jgi:nuclear transport factor 2 (NTF2) superfamily protein
VKKQKKTIKEVYVEFKGGVKWRAYADIVDGRDEVVAFQQDKDGNDIGFRHLTCFSTLAEYLRYLRDYRNGILSITEVYG